MPYARTFKSGDGSTRDFIFGFPYLDQAHVKVYVDGTLTTEWSFFAADTVRFNVAPASGAVILITRATSPTTRLVDYTTPSSLNEADMDADSLQAFYLAQEATDTANAALTVDQATGHLTARNLRIANVADPVNAQDAVTKSWAETALSSQLALAIAARTAAELARDAALTAQALAETAQSGAEAAQAAALASQAAALASENTATAQAAAASLDAAAAEASRVAAEIAETGAGTSETNAAVSAAASAASAAAAATSETNAAASAAAAAASAATAALFDPSSYYTKAEMDTALAGKSNTGHGHVIGDVTGLQASLDTKASLSGAESLFNKTLVRPQMNGAPVDDDHTISGTTPAISAADGTRQFWTLTANATPIDDLSSGEGCELWIDASVYTINWASLVDVWLTDDGVAPTLKTSGYTIVYVEKVGATVYGRRASDGG